MGLMHSLSRVFWRGHTDVQVFNLKGKVVQPWLLEESRVPSHVAVFLSLGVGGNVSEVFPWLSDGVDQYA